VARHRETLGHQVIVADPNVGLMYATRRRGVKTDRRDARTLAEACRLGAYRHAHRASDGQRHVRAELAVRDALIRTRTRTVALAKALIRRDGLRLPSVGLDGVRRFTEAAAHKLSGHRWNPTLTATRRQLHALVSRRRDRTPSGCQSRTRRRRLVPRPPTPDNAPPRGQNEIARCV